MASARVLSPAVRNFSACGWHWYEPIIRTLQSTWWWNVDTPVVRLTYVHNKQLALIKELRGRTVFFIESSHQKHAAGRRYLTVKSRLWDTFCVIKSSANSHFNDAHKLLGRKTDNIRATRGRESFERIWSKVATIKSIRRCSNFRVTSKFTAPKLRCDFMLFLPKSRLSSRCLINIYKMCGPDSAIADTMSRPTLSCDNNWEQPQRCTPFPIQSETRSSATA